MYQCTNVPTESARTFELPYETSRLQAVAPVTCVTRETSVRLLELLASRFNRVRGHSMKRLYWLGFLLFSVAALAAAQDKVFDWVRASDEAAQLDPMDFHAGRVYRPGVQGGNLHVNIQAKLPVTIALAPNDQWVAASQHPGVTPRLDFICTREHIVDTTYECHLPDGRPMVLLIRDERRPDRALMQGIGAVIGGESRRFVSPNDLRITYYRWDCVQNCIQPEFQWSVLLKEKYELSTTPKVYSLLTPERDGQAVWIRIKAPTPMTVALLPSDVADKIYDDPSTLHSALDSTSCKQRGVQSLNFNCKVNVADGRQSLVILPESRGSVPHKKAEIEMQSLQCSDHCDLLNKPLAQHDQPQNQQQDQPPAAPQN